MGLYALLEAGVKVFIPKLGCEGKSKKKKEKPKLVYAVRCFDIVKNISVLKKLVRPCVSF